MSKANDEFHCAMAFGIIRIQKLKSWGDLAGSASHTARDRETPNADPNIKNIRLVGCSDRLSLETLVRNKIGNQTIRKNAVLAVELLLSASPEYFRPDNPANAGMYDKERLEKWKTASVNWLLSQYGDRIVSAELHLDESTPHIHAYLVPLDERGKLNCRALFGGTRYTLSSLQDSYATAIAPLGLVRGIKGSRATHTQIKQYYWDVNQESPELGCFRSLPSPHPTESASSYRERITIELQPSLDIINHLLSDRTLALKQKQEAEQKALASELERQKLEQRLQELEADLQRLKAQVKQLRDLPLEDVAYELGLDCNSKDIWQGQGYTLNIADFRFYDNSCEGYSGSSAIDLVMYVNECNFEKAVTWLRDRFGEEGMLQAVTHQAREQATKIALAQPICTFVPPMPDENRWAAVQHYLLRERHLPANLVQALHEQGLVYADDQRHAVFVMRSLKGETTGAMLWDVDDNKFLGLAKGSRRLSNWFWVGTGGVEEEPIKRVAIANSPIDMLSLFALTYPQGKRTIYLTSLDTRSLPINFLNKVPEVIVAFDNTPVSNETAKQIKQLLPQATRKKPVTNNWNQQLIQTAQSQPLYYNQDLLIG